MNWVLGVREIGAEFWKILLKGYLRFCPAKYMISPSVRVNCSLPFYIIDIVR